MVALSLRPAHEYVPLVLTATQDFRQSINPFKVLKPMRCRERFGVVAGSFWLGSCRQWAGSQTVNFQPTLGN